VGGAQLPAGGRARRGAVLTDVQATPRTPPAFLVTPGLLAGLALFVALLAQQGIGDVGAALAAAGPGLLLVAAFHLVPMLGDTLGWRALYAPTVRPSLTLLLFARWVGESVNNLLPVLQMGGNIAKARVLVRRGVPGAVAGATVVVDVTLVVATQVVFTLVGIALLLAHLGFTRLTLVAAAGAAATTAILAATFVVQRRAPFTVLARLSGRIAGADRQALTAGAAAIDAGVVDLYRDRRAVLAAAGWHLVAWFVGAGEVWLALAVHGHPVPFHTAVLLESLGQAVRTGFFLVPGALGVQEGGFVLLGGALGLAPDTALALSLTRRVRDLVLGLPGLAAWQLTVAAGSARARSGATS
jgi:putative membrane protein